MPVELRTLSRSEWELILHEACLSQIDVQIVRGYILDGLPQCEVGADLDRDRKTVYRHLQGIYPRAKEIAKKLNII
jgi:hypothetical protein